MKCRDCGNKMVIIDKKEYAKFEDFKPQSYVCSECGRVEYI